MDQTFQIGREMAALHTCQMTHSLHSTQQLQAFTGLHSQQLPVLRSLRILGMLAPGGRDIRPQGPAPGQQFPSTSAWRAAVHPVAAAAAAPATPVPSSWSSPCRKRKHAFAMKHNTKINFLSYFIWCEQRAADPSLWQMHAVQDAQACHA